MVGHHKYVFCTTRSYWTVIKLLRYLIIKITLIGKENVLPALSGFYAAVALASIFLLYGGFVLHCNCIYNIATKFILL